MATRRSSLALTYEDYLELPDDRNRYEILEGELEVTPAPSTSHQNVSLKLSIVLGSHVERLSLGIVLTAPCDVLLSDITVVQPDLIFISEARRDIVEQAYVRGTPDLVVEILSPGTARKDRELKRKIYARHQVPNYWLIDPLERRAEAYELAKKDYRQIVVAQGNEPYTAPPFLDLLIPLASLWRL